MTAARHTYMTSRVCMFVCRQAGRQAGSRQPAQLPFQSQHTRTHAHTRTTSVTQPTLTRVIHSVSQSVSQSCVWCVWWLSLKALFICTHRRPSGAHRMRPGHSWLPTNDTVATPEPPHSRLSDEDSTADTASEEEVSRRAFVCGVCLDGSNVCTCCRRSTRPFARGGVCGVRI